MSKDKDTLVRHDKLFIENDKVYNIFIIKIFFCFFLLCFFVKFVLHTERPEVTGKAMRDIEKHLRDHDLWRKEPPESSLDNVDLEIPKLFGNNIDEHFRYKIFTNKITGFKVICD